MNHEYDEELYNEALGRLAAGEKKASIFHNKTGIGISLKQFMNRLYEDTEFYDRYQRANTVGVETMLDDIVEISDSTSLEEVPLAKLRIETRRVVIGRLDGLQRKIWDKGESYRDSKSLSLDISVSDMSEETRQAYVEFYSRYLKEKSDRAQGEQ